MKALLLLILVLCLSATCYAQSGCCWNGDCCQGMQYCCDDCNGSCTCSVNGQCATEEQQEEVRVAKEMFHSFKEAQGKKYASQAEEAKQFNIFLNSVRSKKNAKRLF